MVLGKGSKNKGLGQEYLELLRLGRFGVYCGVGVWCGSYK